MSNDNIGLSSISHVGDEEPAAKRHMLTTGQGYNVGSIISQNSLKICKSAGSEDHVPAGNESSFTRRKGQANHNQKVVLKDVGFTSNSFIGPRCQKDIVEIRTDIESELDKFYKELDQIEPTQNVDQLDVCNADKSTSAQKPQSPQQEIQSDFNQPTRCQEPHSGQFLQNKSQNLRHLHQYWNVSWSPPSQSSNDLCSGVATHTMSQRLMNQFPSPFLPPPPPPRLPLYPFCDGGLRHNFRDPSQQTFQWENMPIKSSHTNQGGNHCADQDRYKVIRSELGCNESYSSKPDCSESSGQASSFCQRNSKEYSLQLILMRGAPGSGKSTFAKELLSSCPHGVILSTDDYFLQEGHYIYDSRFLGDAHHWNQNRTQEALFEYRSPIIIDNTNMQAWEMKPYVQMAAERGYIVCFCEPNTSWKYDPSELERRNKHGVPRQKIAKMLERFELPMTVDIVLNSQEPHQCTELSFKQQRKRRRDDCFFH